jgi:hypothetical protein
VDLRELIQLVQQWLRGPRQVNTVRTPIARILLPLQIAFLAKTIDQSARRDLPDLERICNDALGRTRVARDGCDQGPLGPREAAFALRSDRRLCAAGEQSPSASVQRIFSGFFWLRCTPAHAGALEFNFSWALSSRLGPAFTNTF